MRTRTILVLAILLMAGAPAILAAPTPIKNDIGWAHAGQTEPNTKYDRDSGLMFLGPDTNVSGAQVYLNGFLGTEGPYSINSGTLGTGYNNYPTVTYAMLGVWKDCNLDGYVGLGDEALTEYRATLLPANSPCTARQPDSWVARSPPSPVSNLYHRPNWGNQLPSHNDGVWVRELIPIGWDDLTSTVGDDSPYDIHDAGARVWSDWGAPGAPVLRQCWTTVMERGTWKNTGGLLRYGDCHTNYRITQNVLNESANRLHALAPGMGFDDYRFDDVSRDHPEKSSSKWNMKNPLGYGEGSETYYTAFNCNQPIAYRALPTGSSGTNGVGLYTPRTPTTHTNGNAMGTVNYTQNALNDCNTNDQYTAEEGSLGDAGYRQLENDFTNTVDIRQRPDNNLGYIPSPRPANVGFIVAGQSPVGRSAPGDLGVAFGRNEGYWVGEGVMTFSKNPYFNKDTLSPEAVTYVTYYAYVTPSTKYSLPSGIVGMYGANECAKGAASTFDCNVDNWYPGTTPDRLPRSERLGKDPNDPTQAFPYGVYVDQVYNLMDVDCYDTSVRAVRDNTVVPTLDGPFSVLAGSNCL